MTSVIVPPVDLAPGMPSRVVTISATDVTEGGQSLAGQMVRFALSDTLDVTSGGDVIAKTQAEVVLDSNGEGRIRLPVYTDAVKTWCGDPDWAILVTATWGSQKAVRVPAGTSSIALSSLPPVRPLRGREKQWAVTGASVSVTEGAQWDVDVSLSGGILDFDFTVPPGAVAWELGLATGDLNSYTTTGRRYSPGYAAAANRPEGAGGGSLLTYRTAATFVGHTWVDDAGWTARRVQTAAGGWTAWRRHTWEHPALDGSVLLDNLVTPGTHPIPSTAVATAIGAPSAGLGGVLVEPTTYSGANGTIVRQTVWDYTTNTRWQRTRLASGAWNSWDAGIVRSDLGSGSGSIARLSKWTAESPPVSTGGKGAVAFTFDHGLTNFKAKGLPAALASRGFKYGLALNDSTLSTAENSGASDADVLSWAGAEIWNHGYNHSSTRNEATVRSIIVQGKTALEARYGREVFGFIPAGVGPDGLAGFDGGSTPEMWSQTLAGQLILEYHAVTTGYMGSGGIRQLTGQVQQGVSRFTMDSQTLSRIKMQIDLAINDGVGVMFMLHPALMGTAGYISVADVIAVLDYAKARQDAGDLAVLSPGELVRADAGAGTDWSSAIAALNSAAQ